METKKESIFRKKSVAKMSSPEELQDYIHVSTISAWTVLTAIIILLVGALVWGIFGEIEMKKDDGSKEYIAPIKLIIN